MADDIKIKVGVESTVKAGMDKVVSDIKKASSGKGFKEIFSRAMTGDISGAVEDLQVRLGASWKGAALKWGAGIGTAIIAGWKAGRMLDEAFGISDKLAAAWLKFSNGVVQTYDQTYQRLRKIRQNWEAEQKAAIETDAKIFDMREKRRLGGMSGSAKVDYFQQNVDTLESTVQASGISATELSERRLELERQRGYLAEALAQQAEEYAAKGKAEYDQKIAQEKELADAKKRSAEFEAEMLKKTLEQEKAGIDAAIEKDRERVEARIEAIRKVANMEAKFQALQDEAADPNSWRAAKKKASDATRDERRKQRALDNARANLARGVDISDRERAMIAAADAVGVAAQAGVKADAMEAAWKRKQAEGAQAMINLEKRIANIARA